MFEFIAQHRYTVNGFVLLRDGAPIVEAYCPPYSSETMHHSYSVTKSFVSALVGIAIADGSIKRVDQPIVELLPAETRRFAAAKFAAVTVRHALTMTCGFEWAEARTPYGRRTNSVRQMQRERDWVRYVLERPIVSTPGASFAYSSGASHLLAAALQNATGASVASYAQRRLLEPLGISNYSWTADPAGINTGGWGLYLRPRDMAKLGTLYLDGGRWGGAEVVPEAWIRESTSHHSKPTSGSAPNQRVRSLARRLSRRPATRESFGYGYHWWLPGFGGYAALGAGGQAIYVLPTDGAVVVITGGLSRDRTQLRNELMEKFVLPELRSFERAGVDHDDAAGDSTTPKRPLRRRPRWSSRQRSSTADHVSAQTYLFGANASGIQSISLDFRRDSEAMLKISLEGEVRELCIGLDDDYRHNKIGDSDSLALRGGWTTDRTFDLEWCWLGSGERLDISLRFAGDRLSFESRGAIDGHRLRLVGRKSA